MDEQITGYDQASELEQYGVWVKAGPVDIDDEIDEIEMDEIDDLGDLGDLDDLAAHDDLEMPSFDVNEIDTSDIHTIEDVDLPDASDGTGEALEAIDLHDGDDESDDEGVALEIIDLDDELDASFSETSEPGESDDAPAATADDDADDDELVTLDDLDIEEPDDDPDPFAALPDDHGASFDDPGDLDAFSASDETTPASPPVARDSAGDDSDELELEDLGDAELGSDDDEETSALSLDEEAEELDLDELQESLDDDFERIELDDEAEDEFDVSMPGSDDELSSISLDDIDVGNDGADLPEIELAEEADDLDALDDDLEDLDDLEEPDDTADDELPPEHDFVPDSAGIEIPTTPVAVLDDDEALFLDDEDPSGVLLPDEIAVDAEETPPLHDEGERDIEEPMDAQEREAFDRIQTELSDIKRELADLKMALRSGLVASAVPAEAAVEAHDAPAEEVDDADDFSISLPDPAETPTGFFEEDDDETIALTGDELDNILNTAEFTETTGEAEEVDEDLLTPTLPEDAFATAPAVDEISLEPADDAPFVVDGDDTAVDELADLDIDRELEGIESLTDDTEAPEEDAFDEIELDLDSLDDIDDAPDEDSLDAGDEIATLSADDAPSAELHVDDSPLDEDDLLDEDDPLAITEDDVEEGSSVADDDFGAFAERVEHDIAETSDDPLDEDELDVDELTLDEPESDELSDDLDDFDDLEDDLTLPDDLGDETLEESGDEPDAGAPDLADAVASASSISELPEDLKNEIRSVLSYMDQLLEALPDEKIEEFAQSEHFEVYRRLFEELGLET